MRWRHRRRGSLLAFFDVQPITVKAYGGRRYTRAKELTLQAKQKTRGRFYLFSKLQGFRSTSGADRKKSLELQDIRHCTAQVWIIVYDQDIQW